MNEQGPARAALSAEAAAEYLGGAPITARTLQNLVRRREIGFAKIGRALVFPVAALDAYLAEQTQDPTPNSWGLTEGSLRTVREGSPQDRVRRRTELFDPAFRRSRSR